MSKEDYKFVLKRIVEVKTSAHKIIGEPLPYSDLKEKVSKCLYRDSKTSRFKKARKYQTLFRYTPSVK